MYQTIKIESRENICTIKFDNEQTMNAMSQLFLKEFHEAIENVANDRSCRVLILRGTEKVFSAGGNLHEIAEADFEKAKLMATNAHYIYDGLLNLNIPVIAALDGIVFGGGLELALRCDIRFGTLKTRMRFPEVNMGIIPGAGGITFLSKYLSPSDIAYYVYSCEDIPVEFAHQHGIIQKIVESENLYQYTFDFARKLVQKPQNAIAAAKHELVSTLNRNFNESLEIEINEFVSTLQTSGKEKIAEFFKNKKN